MKPIGNIFGFDCVTCEHNRNCYGGNIGNQFRYCQKSIEKVQNLDKLEQENKKYKEVIDKLKNKTKENIENAKCEITTLTIGDKAYYQYIEKILDNYVDILKEVE